MTRELIFKKYPRSMLTLPQFLNFVFLYFLLSKMIYVYTVTRRCFFDDISSDSEGSSKFISVHRTLDSANKAAKAHCKSQIREAGGSTRQHQIEFSGGVSPIAAFAKCFKGTVFIGHFNDGRVRIEVEVNEVESREDGTNGDNDLEDWDSDGDDDDGNSVDEVDAL
jgi:hypothetical protein